MAAGKKFIVDLSGGSSRTLKNIEFVPFTYDAADLAASTSVVEKRILTKDGAGTKNSWQVKLTYIAADIPATSTTLAQIISACETAISALYGSAELSAFASA